MEKVTLVPTSAVWDSMKVCSAKERQKMERHRNSVAYHEAGHAVFAWALHVPIDEVSIGFLNDAEHDQDGLFIGVCYCGPYETVTANILVTLAGIRGEQVIHKQLTHDMHASASRDYKVALEILEALSGATEEAAAKLFRRFKNKAKELAERPEFQLAITVVAKSLIERDKLSGSDVHKLCLDTGLEPIS